jgi:hypothetical protein
MSFGMLLETSLLIIRANRPPPLEDRMPHLLDPKHRREAKAGTAADTAARADAAGADVQGKGKQRARKQQQGKQEVQHKPEVDKKRD